ncbi:kinesin [Penicillium sp. IBT 16267x]|nr:kinesin [Penicillium sp. IBT 16267x]
MTNRAPRRTIQQYLDEFQKSERKRIKLLEHGSGNPQRDWEASNSILITWQISFDYIQEVSKSAADLLSLMSFFDRQGIPEYVLREGKADKAPDLSEDGSIGEEDIEYCGSDDVGEDSITFAMHALVQLATRNWLDSHGGIEPPKARFVRNLCRDLPGGGFEDWEKYQTLFPHVQAAASIGDLEEMKRMAVKSKNETEKVLGSEHERTLACISRVANLYIQIGKWQDAEKLNQQVLTARREIIGIEHPDTLTSMPNLALTYDNLGRLQDEEALHLEVLRIRQKVLGDRHDDTLDGMDNLGLNYWRQG